MYRGTYTALVTPFRDGRVDEEALRKLVDRQVAGGVTGIVPVGTTGESPTVDEEEQLDIIRIAVEQAAGRVQVLAGTGANATSEAIRLTEAAEQAGADGSLQVTPYYNKPSQEGIYQHYKAVAESTNLPIMLYNVPGRAVVQIDVGTAVRLANDCETIVAIKEAGGDPERVTALKAALPEGFPILCGDDGLTMEFLKRGAVGTVSVVSNIIPDVVSRIVNGVAEGREAEADALFQKYATLMEKIMGLDTNPVPIKAAVAMLGWSSEEIRLPLVRLAPDKQEILRGLLTQYGLLS